MRGSRRPVLSHHSKSLNSVEVEWLRFSVAIWHGSSSRYMLVGGLVPMLFSSVRCPVDNRIPPGSVSVWQSSLLGCTWPVRRVAGSARKDHTAPFAAATKPILEVAKPKPARAHGARGSRTQVLCTPLHTPALLADAAALPDRRLWTTPHSSHGRVLMFPAKPEGFLRKWHRAIDHVAR